MDQTYDLVIVGGGMVGAALACALSESQYRIALIEQLLPASFSVEQPHDLRVSALSLASEALLKKIGVWSGILARRACPYQRMKVWELDSERAATEFNSAEIGEPHLGHIVENRVVQWALIDRIRQSPNIRLITPATPLEIDYVPGASLVRLDNGEELVARLLIGADGGESAVARAAGLGVLRWDYAQHALIATVTTAAAQQDITWQEFRPTGPVALLPLSGSHASLVWYHQPDEVKRRLALDPEAFRQALMQEFPSCLGEILTVESRGSFPLRRQHAQNYVAEGVALIGDAAHMIHPLAGQGVNIGFMDVAILAELLLHAEQTGQAVSDLAQLAVYEKKRRYQNLLMMQTMDAFYRVFSNDLLPLKWARNLGLGLGQHLPWARREVTRFATGSGRYTPKWMQS